MPDTCTIYPTRSDYEENENWDHYIHGEELPKKPEEPEVR